MNPKKKRIDEFFKHLEGTFQEAFRLHLDRPFLYHPRQVNPNLPIHARFKWNGYVRDGMEHRQVVSLAKQKLLSIYKQFMKLKPSRRYVRRFTGWFCYLTGLLVQVANIENGFFSRCGKRRVRGEELRLAHQMGLDGALEQLRGIN